MRNQFRTYTLNLKSKDRMNQDTEHDGVNDTAMCEFALTPPLLCKEQCRFALNNAYMPLSFTNVEEGVNDRFGIIFRPAEASTDANSVFVTVQLKAGQYNTITNLASQINTQLAKLTSTMATSLTSDGGIVNTYNANTTAILATANLECAVSTDEASKDHLEFKLKANSVFSHSSNVLTKDGGGTGTTAIAGMFQIVFGFSGTVLHQVAGRSCATLAGFSGEQNLIKPDGSYQPFPSTPQARADATADQVINSPNLGSIIATPYINVRCSLVRDALEAKAQRTRKTNILHKIPLTSTAFGSALYLEPDDANPCFNLEPGEEISNIQIILTDDDGKRLKMNGVDWSMTLIFKGIFN